MAECLEISDLRLCEKDKEHEEWKAYTTASFPADVVHESLPTLPSIAGPATTVQDPPGLIIDTDLKENGAKFALVWQSSVQHLAEAFCILEDMKLVRWCYRQLSGPPSHPFAEQQQWLNRHWRFVATAIIAYSRCFDVSPNGSL